MAASARASPARPARADLADLLAGDAPSVPRHAALAGGRLLGAADSGRVGSAGSIDAAVSRPGGQAGGRRGSPVRAGGGSLLGGLEETLSVGGGILGPADPFAAAGGGEGPRRVADPEADFLAPDTGSGERSEAAQVDNDSLMAAAGRASGGATAAGRRAGGTAVEQQSDLLGGFSGTLGARTQPSTPPCPSLAPKILLPELCVALIHCS